MGRTLPGFSIIICSYNPDSLIFSRLLSAIENLKQPVGADCEIIIVDNNSTPSLSERPEIISFLKVNPEALIVKELMPGLTSARITGVKQASYNWIIFFDDDNEPADNYLLQLTHLIGLYPPVGLLGPGIIKVEFIGKVSSFAMRHKELFQERNMAETIIDNVRWEQDAYPYGTGMIIKKEIVDEYLRQVEKGNYTMSDRIGKSLISGGDIQMLLTGIKMGFYAGSSPLLKMNHLIKSEKTAFKKMLQLVFMLSASALKSYNEVFTDAPFQLNKVSNKDAWLVFYGQFRRHIFKKSVRDILFDISKKMGELQAVILATSSLKKPYLLSVYKKLISN